MLSCSHAFAPTGNAAAAGLVCTLAGPEGGQEWSQICALLTAPVPSLQSRVLAPEAAAKIGAHGAPPRCPPSVRPHSFAADPFLPAPAACQGAAGLDDRDTLHLQQLLLEGIANGTVRHGGDVERLVLSTFAAAQQVGPCCCALKRRGSALAGWPSLPGMAVACGRAVCRPATPSTGPRHHGAGLPGGVQGADGWRQAAGAART
jgi:hypothetical protein